MSKDLININQDKATEIQIIRIKEIIKNNIITKVFNIIYKKPDVINTSRVDIYFIYETQDNYIHCDVIYPNGIVNKQKSYLGTKEFIEEAKKRFNIT
jgi:hypothetical protein